MASKNQKNAKNDKNEKNDTIPKEPINLGKVVLVSEMSKAKMTIKCCQSKLRGIELMQQSQCPDDPEARYHVTCQLAQLADYECCLAELENYVDDPSRYHEVTDTLKALAQGLGNLDCALVGQENRLGIFATSPEPAGQKNSVSPTTAGAKTTSTTENANSSGSPNIAASPNSPTSCPQSNAVGSCQSCHVTSGCDPCPNCQSCQGPVSSPSNAGFCCQPCQDHVSSPSVTSCQTGSSSGCGGCHNNVPAFATGASTYVRIIAVHSKCVQVMNTSVCKDYDLGNHYLVQRVSGHPTAVYQFPPRLHFPCQAVVTVWSGLNDLTMNCPPTDFLFREHLRWDCGPDCITVLCTPCQQTIAWLTLACPCIEMTNIYPSEPYDKKSVEDLRVIDTNTICDPCGNAVVGLRRRYPPRRSLKPPRHPFDRQPNACVHPHRAPPTYRQCDTFSYRQMDSLWLLNKDIRSGTYTYVINCATPSPCH